MIQQTCEAEQNLYAAYMQLTDADMCYDEYIMLCSSAEVQGTEVRVKTKKHEVSSSISIFKKQCIL
jgi:hypothetical protein